MSESTNSRGSRRSHPESISSSRASRPPKSVSSQLSVRTHRLPSDGSHTNSSKRRALPSWCYVPPKEGGSTLKKNVTLFGKTVDVYWCPHHERWDTHRLRECPTEVELESYKHQLEIFFISRQELLETQQKLAESEQKIKNQRTRLGVLEQKLRDAGIHKPSTADVPLGEDMQREETKSLQTQSEEAKEELKTTNKELSESEEKIKKQRQKCKSKNGEQDSDEPDELQRRLEESEKKSENRKKRILQTEAIYKETKERLKEEQELCKKLKTQLEEQVASNARLERELQDHSASNGSPRSNGEYDRREEADRSIYRLSESLATVTGALESERAAKMALEKDFAQERKEYKEKLRDMQAQLERCQMLLTVKRQTSATSNGSFRNNANYVKICRLLIYSHHNVDDEKVQQIKETATDCSVGGFVKGGRPGLIVVEGLEEKCDAFLNALAKQHRMLRDSPRKGKVESATFAAAGKVISQADTIDEGRAFPNELTQLDSEGGFDELKALCASTGMLDLIDEVCKR